MGKVISKKVDHVSARLSTEEMDRIDALIPRFSTPWRKATRSDVVRFLILQGFAAEEKRAAQARHPRRRMTS